MTKKSKLAWKKIEVIVCNIIAITMFLGGIALYPTNNVTCALTILASLIIWNASKTVEHEIEYHSDDIK